MITPTTPTVLAVGEWVWTDCGEDDEPALGTNHFGEFRAGDNVDAADLRRLALDLMKLANLVAKHEQASP
jgi:hypothetical protein